MCVLWLVPSFLEVLLWLTVMGSKEVTVKYFHSFSPRLPSTILMKRHKHNSRSCSSLNFPCWRLLPIFTSSDFCQFTSLLLLFERVRSCFSSSSSSITHTPSFLITPSSEWNNGYMLSTCVSWWRWFVMMWWYGVCVCVRLGWVLSVLVFTMMYSISRFLLIVPHVWSKPNTQARAMLE